MEKQDNLVSIGIPFYNCEKYLEFAIKSVLNQSYTNWELILLDDGSKDNSINIARSFNDKRIKIVSDGENLGLVKRLNQLTSMSRGKYYARMDADDIMHFDRIQKQLDFLINNPEVDVVGSRYYAIDVDNKIVGITNVNINPNSVKSVLKSGCFAHPSVLGKTEWFKNNPYNERWNTMMEDFELWLRSVSNSNFRNIPEPLFFYRNVGIPTLRKYVRQTFNVMKVLQMRDKYNISFFDSFFYTAKNSLKIITYCVFYCFGSTDYLVKKRSEKLSNTEVKNASENLLKSIN